MTVGRRSVAIVAALLLSVSVIMSPLGEAALDLSSLGRTWNGYALALAPTVPNMRDSHRLELARDNLPEGVRMHYVMGSSELSSLAPQNPVTWLPSHSSDFVVFLSGRGHVQSLSHAIELAAVAPLLASPKVTLILSPQWFVEGGVGAEAFMDVFSYSYFEAMLDNPLLSSRTKKRILARVKSLGGPELWSRPDRAFESRLSVLRERLKTNIDLRLQSKSVPRAEARIDAVDWTREFQLAHDQGVAAAHNEFHVADPYYETYVKPNLATSKGSMADSTYLASPEYGDLDVFLTVAREVNVEVMLVSVPMNGWWYDYMGYSATGRAAYYDKIRDVAAAAGVRLADFSDKDYEPAFLYDIMHLGWKGWLSVTRACVEFESAA